MVGRGFSAAPASAAMNTPRALRASLLHRDFFSRPLMAALVLSIAGAAAGSSVLGPIGAIVGRLVGAVAGNVIDRVLFGTRRDISLEGPRLSDLTVMASTEGAPIA